MSDASSTLISGGVPRTLPRPSELIREEVRITMPRLTQGRPYAGALLLIVMVWIFRDSEALPLVLGMVFPLSVWHDRMLGRSSLWERPIRRRTGNLIRHFTALGLTVGSVAFLTLLLSLAGKLELVVSPEHTRFAAVAGGAILVYGIVSISGQLMNPRRMYVVALAMMLPLPLLVLPTRFFLRILPAFLHPLLIGSYGLDVFLGKAFNAPAASGLGMRDWWIAAGLWIPCCVLAVAAVASTHHE